MATENSQPFRHMKWWGWGHEEVAFDDSNKPGLWPYLRRELQVPEGAAHTKPVAFESVQLPEIKRNEPFLAALRTRLAPDQIVEDKRSRLIHAAGKSFRDLWRLRQGLITVAPDCVVYPHSEDDVVAVIRAAVQHQVVVIPFGGGSNIAGCLEPHDQAGRMVVSLDMGRMHRVLEVDTHSLTARIQAGVYGPHMEEQLAAHNVTLGHFPDSFVHSTLGGWLATRSAGMQSDKYGKIEDMVLSLRMVTPQGTIVTRTVPKCANGIDVRQLCVGSEGILGVITEAVMQVHPQPAHKDYYGWLFPDFESGAASIHECMRRGCMPVITRLNDPQKTALSFAFKTSKPPLKEAVGKVVKWYLGKVRGIDFSKCCLMIVACEGDHATFHRVRQESANVFRKHGGVYLGVEPGRSFQRAKFDFPHLRDYVMDRNIMADVSETATTWANLLPSYYDTRRSIEQAICDTGSAPWVGCHISHNYHSGASLYYTFGALQSKGRELAQYLYVKKAAEDAFMRNGGTLSHHHAVGSEHIPWVTDDISATGVAAVRALKHGLDPGGIMNPGKILPSENPLETWGLPESVARQFNNTGK